MKSSVRMNFAGHKGLIVPFRGRDDEGRVIPDATFAPAELRLFRNAPPWMSTDGVAMLVEVTSSRPEKDRDAKRRAYADAGITLYLLADCQRRRITLFSDPSGGDCTRDQSAPFGSDLELPKPFAFALNTSEFGDQA
jgi:hypothetical protein